MANKLKVGDICYSLNQSRNFLYCIFRIEHTGIIGVVTHPNGYIYLGEYLKVLQKARSTKKRKKLFLKVFQQLLLSGKERNPDSFTNLDYIEVVDALTHG